MLWSQSISLAPVIIGEHLGDERLTVGERTTQEESAEDHAEAPQYHYAHNKVGYHSKFRMCAENLQVEEQNR